MKKNKNGFTLVEIIVCIAIIAVLGVVATFGLQKVLKKGNRDQYISDIKDLNDAAKIYIAVYYPNSSSGSFMIKRLIEEGYLDENFYQKKNPASCKTFTNDTSYLKNQIFFLTDSNTKVKRIYLKKNSGETPQYFLDDAENWLPTEVCP